MPYNFPSPAVSVSNIKIKWKEQYVSAGLNKKLGGIVPSGVYRGFNLTTHGSNNTVQLTADSGYGDHLAVAEDTNGYSLTYRDKSGSPYVLALTDASLYSQTVVICLVLDYTINQDTTGTFRAYTLAEFEALSASALSELVVIGTVVNPAASNTISAGSISHDRRSIASFSNPVLDWRPLISNGRFEKSPEDVEIVAQNTEGWVSSGDFWTSTSDVEFGARCLEYKIASSGTKTATCIQRMGTSVVEGQRIAVRFSKKVIATASSGSGEVVIQYANNEGDYGTVDSQSFVIDATDADYVTTTAVFDVPAAVSAILWIGIKFTSAVYGSSGVKVRFGQFKALLDAQDVYEQNNSTNDRMRNVNASSVVIHDDDLIANNYADLAAALTFSRSLPNTAEGSFKIGRKDGGASLGPAVDIIGRIISLGSSLLGTEANALKARITAPVSTTADVSFTLLWESVPSGLKGVRLYVGDLDASTISEPGFFITVNAYFDGTNWNKDINAQRSAAFYVVADDVVKVLYQATGTDTWLSSAWLPIANIKDGTSAITNALTIGGTLGVTGLLTATAGVTANGIITANAGASVPDGQTIDLIDSARVTRTARPVYVPVSLGTVVDNVGVLTKTTGVPGVNWPTTASGYIPIPLSDVEAENSVITELKVYQNLTGTGSVRYRLYRYWGSFVAVGPLVTEATIGPYSHTVYSGVQYPVIDEASNDGAPLFLAVETTGTVAGQFWGIGVVLDVI